MITVGQKFMSYEELQIAIEEFEFSNNVKFMKLKTSKLNKFEIPNVNDKLIYRAIIFQCIRGGPFIKRGKGLRNRSTEKQDCPAHINLRLSNDAQSLIVRSIENEHNHEILERWVYFKDGISRSIRKKLNLKKMFMRNSPYQMDGHVNLYAALIEPKALEALQHVRPRKRKRVNQEDIEASTETVTMNTYENALGNEQSPIKDCDTNNEECFMESEYSEKNEECYMENEECAENGECAENEHPIENAHSVENRQCEIENEQPPIEKDQCSTSSELCHPETEYSSKINTIIENQKIFLNTLNIINENIHILNTNMVSMANTLNNLVDKVSNISHIILKKPPQS